MSKIREHLKLIRVKHYIKNLLIFLPLVFSGNLMNFDLLINVLIAFFIFSFCASVVYIINDIKDIEKDKLHEKKKNRPLAKGTISKKEAIVLACLLISISFVLSFMINKIDCIYYVLFYLFINFCYSFKLKNVPILDITILTLGFIIRVMYGCAIIDVSISSWLYLTIMSMSFYLALGKRRNEIIKSKNNTRDVLKYYNKEFLDKFMYLCLGLTIVFYSLWTVGENICKYRDYLVLSVPLVIIICMKYSMIIEGDSDGDPTEVVLNDKILLGLCVIYALFILLLFYL